MYSSSTHTFMSYFLKYEGYIGCSFRINSYPSSISHIASLIEISHGSFMRKMSSFCFCLKSSYNIDTSIIIFKLGLRAEDHEEEFLIWCILEYLTIRSYLMKSSLIHKVNHRSKISCISRKSIWSPGKDRIVFSLPESFKKSIESFSRS